MGWQCAPVRVAAVVAERATHPLVRRPGLLFPLDALPLPTVASQSGPALLPGGLGEYLVINLALLAGAPEECTYAAKL